MKVQLHTTQAIVTESTEEERLWLSSYLSFADSSSRYKTGNKGKAQKMRLFNRYHNTFPAGLYGLVRRGVLRKNFTLELDDRRVAPCSRDANADLGWLRWYQNEAVDTVDEEKTGIVQAPTGSGKTEIACALVISQPCLWLFLVHRKGLVNDMATRYHLRTGRDAIVYKEGMKIPATGLVVATFQTFIAALRKCSNTAETMLKAARGLIVDECHIQAADSFYTISMGATNAYFRVGLSGTPLARGDRRSVKAVAALGPVIYRIKSQTLIDEGMLATPIIRMVPVEQYSAKPTFQGIYGDIVVKSPTRHKAITDSVEKAAKPCIVFVKQLNHGVELKKRLLKCGYNVEFVSGRELESKRKSMKQNLERGELDVLIASVVFQEGVDIPNLESVVMAHGGKSIIATLQRIGRGMRTNQGKKLTFEVWDIYDQGCSMLEKHSKTRKRAYEREGFKVEVLDTVYKKRSA